MNRVESYGFPKKNAEIVNTRLIPGALDELNNGAIDWSNNGLIAYGCFNHIIILDYHVLEIVQTLTVNHDIVTRLAWKVPDSDISLDRRIDSMNILSGDASGSLILANVHSKQIIASCIKYGGPVKMIKWVSFEHEKKNFALVLFSPDIVALFSGANLYVCWRLKYVTEILSVALSSCDSSTISINCTQSIHVYDDFCYWDYPKALYKKLNVVDGCHEFSIEVDLVGKPCLESTDKMFKPQKSLLDTASNVFRTLQSRSEKNSLTDLPNESQTSTILSSEFLPYFGKLLIITINRTVLVYNVESEQILTNFNVSHEITSFYLFKNLDSFILVSPYYFSVYTSNYTDISNTVPSKSKPAVSIFVENAPFTPSLLTSLSYRKIASAEPIKIGRQTYFSSFAFNPITEMEFVYISGTGMPFFYQLPIYLQESGRRSLHLSLKMDFKDFLNQLCSNSIDLDFTTHSKTLRCLQSCVLYNINIYPTCVRVSPTTTIKTRRSFRLYAAIGFRDGSIQILNLPFGVVRRHFSIFSYSIKQIEWLTHNSVIVLSYDKVVNKCELCVVDVQTGDTHILQYSSKSIQDHILAIVISETRSYFLLTFFSGHVQLWDAIELKFLSYISNANYMIETVNWSFEDCTASNDKLFEKKPNPDDIDFLFPSTEKTLPLKEKLYVMSNKLILREMEIEGNSVREQRTTSLDKLVLNSIQCAENKGNLLIVADSDANIALIDLKKASSSIYQNKGQKIQNIKFGPFIGNPLMAIKFNESFQVWNSASLSIIYDSKRHIDSPIVDIDWVGSNLLIILYSHGAVEIIDILKGSSKIHFNMLYHNSSYTSFNMSNEIYSTLKYLVLHLFEVENINSYSSLQNYLIIEYPDDQKMALFEKFNSFKKNYYIELNSVKSFCHRLLYVYRLFGDNLDVVFWKVTGYFLKYYSTKDEGNTNETDLELGYMHLCNRSSLLKIYSWLIMIEKQKYISTESNLLAFRYISRWLLYLKKNHEYSDLKFKSEVHSDFYYHDILKALIACQIDVPSHYATNCVDSAHILLKLGKLSDALEYLLLTKNYFETCKVLVDVNMVQLALLLSKLLLNKHEIFSFTTYLYHKNREMKSWNFTVDFILYMISTNRFDIAIKLLFDYGRTDLAYLLKVSCDSVGIKINYNTLEMATFNETFVNCLNEKYRSMLKSINIDADSLLNICIENITITE